MIYFFIIWFGLGLIGVLMFHEHDNWEVFKRPKKETVKIKTKDLLIYIGFNLFAIYFGIFTFCFAIVFTTNRK
jgi:hypothetical protein